MKKENIIVSIVIPNWNGIKFIGACLKSIFRSRFEGYEVIVVDNRSEDGSIAFIEKEYPQVNLIKLERNFGFAKACNIGAKFSHGEWVILLNNDIEVHEQWLENLVEGMRRNPDCAMGTSKMLFLDKRDILYNTADVLTEAAIGGGRGFGEKDTGQYEVEGKVFGACAGAGIYQKRMIQEISFLDEDFFIFAEDVDFNLRAQLYGYNCVYIPDAIVYHIGTATVGFHSNRHVFLFMRNNLFILIKNYPLQKILKDLLKIFFYRLEQVKQCSFSGQGKVVFMSFLSFLWFLPKMFYKRWQLRREILLDFTPFENLIQKESNG